MDPNLHCWEDGPRTYIDDTWDECGTGSTCLLPDGHDGDHEFTPDDQITVSFAARQTGET